MKNKRRSRTQTQYEGTETGSVTYTVTFFPDIFESDKALVQQLDELARAKQTSAWLRNAVISYLAGGATPQVRRVEKEAPIPSPRTEGGASSRAAEGMGLKFGKR